MTIGTHAEKQLERQFWSLSVTIDHPKKHSMTSCGLISQTYLN